MHDPKRLLSGRLIHKYGVEQPRLYASILRGGAWGLPHGFHSVLHASINRPVSSRPFC
jgi:hypothetical protein